MGRDAIHIVFMCQRTSGITSAVKICALHDLHQSASVVTLKGVRKPSDETAELVTPSVVTSFNGEGGGKAAQLRYKLHEGFLY